MNCKPRISVFSQLSAILVLLFTLETALAQTSQVWPSTDWSSADPADVGLQAKLLAEARRYALTAGGSGLLLRHGKVVMRWGDQRRKYDIKSATKSFGATMLGVALKDGYVELSDLAKEHHPSFGESPGGQPHTDWTNNVTLLHLATQTAGFEKRGGYEKIIFSPGTQWHYSDGGPNWLAECITLKYRRDLRDVMFERIFAPIGISQDDLSWRSHQYRDDQLDGIKRREFGAGIHANVGAMARFGYLYLREGRWQDQQLLPKSFIRYATRPVAEVIGLPEWSGQESHGNASDHYGLLWWNNADGTLRRVPRDAYWAWGLYDSLIVIIPSLDLVVVRAGERGRSLARQPDENHYEVLAPFLEPIVAAAGVDSDNWQLPSAPYPASPVIVGIEWAKRESILRKAAGSDNWPITWADDDLLYTAYGDGRGFQPHVERKVSLGLAAVSGEPPGLHGENLRSSDAEEFGDGAQGAKASGMLMVDGTLYMLVRNRENAQLRWSEDRGRTWESANWKWTKSFGSPTFLNFGQNYSRRPAHLEKYVFVYSADSDSAYLAADRMVLARVPKDKIRQRDAYEFYAGIDEATQGPRWSAEIEQRAAVFEHKGNCYRSGITYNAGLKRFLWCQTLPESIDARGPRFQGGFGIYESAEPWGPWRTVFYTTDWDVGPGETSCFPTKWMSKDGRKVHLLFSGDDCFSVRSATLQTVMDGHSK